MNHGYIFDSFIEGDCNRVARRAGKTVAEKPGANSFNPLVIYGGVGLGKTHLAQAIGNDVKRIHPNKVVLYVSSEKFINQFQDHSRNNAINDFIHFYQLIDVLLTHNYQCHKGNENIRVSLEILSSRVSDFYLSPQSIDDCASL